MEYVREILRQHLVDESNAYMDAVKFLNGGQPSLPKGLSSSTWEAFVETKRLAEERIPALQAAIDILDKSWDYFRNAPKEPDNGNRLAFKSNVI